PFTCMGGIKLDNVDLVLKQGAQIVAVVTAVTAATDQCAAARALRTRIIGGRRVTPTQQG
ncbi:MAG TPA: thiamine phosphate synthase, partial [Candidatus Hydrogenedentes bacterium]|nr:thiamine phosphate synthase [Candidatus Hydrogenedentota bacterium]